MARFSEVIGPHTQGVDVVTGSTLDLTAPVPMGPRGVYVLELR